MEKIDVIKHLDESKITSIEVKKLNSILDVIIGDRIKLEFGNI